MSRSQQVEVHMEGITSQEEVDALEQQLKAQQGVDVRRVEKTRIVLAYDPEAVTATELQGLIESAGGEVITIGPSGRNVGRATAGEEDVEQYRYHYYTSHGEAGWFFVGSLEEAKEQGQQDLEGGDKKPSRITDDLGHVLVEWKYDPGTSAYEMVEHG